MSNEVEKDSYLAQLYTALNYSYQNFDKYVITVASGAFGIFLGLTDKLVNTENSYWKGFLLTSFYLLGVTISLALIAHFISARFISKCIEVYNDEKKFNALQKSYNNKIFWINVVNIGTLLMGIISFVIYLQLNFNRMKEEKLKHSIGDELKIKNAMEIPPRTQPFVATNDPKPIQPCTPPPSTTPAPQGNPGSPGTLSQPVPPKPLPVSPAPTTPTEK